jgi:hypothetical protein
MLTASNDRRVRDVAALQSALFRETSRRHELGQELKLLSTRERSMAAERDQLQRQMQASFALMQRRCLEWLEQMTQAATLRQRKFLSVEIAKFKASQAEKQHDLQRQLLALQEQLDWEARKRLRLEHTVATVLEESAEQCRQQSSESLEGQHTRHASEIDAYHSQHSCEGRVAREENAEVQAACHSAKAANSRPRIEVGVSMSMAQQMTHARSREEHTLQNLEPLTAWL